MHGHRLVGMKTKEATPLEPPPPPYDETVQLRLFCHIDGKQFSKTDVKPHVPHSSHSSTSKRKWTLSPCLLLFLAFDKHGSLFSLSSEVCLFSQPKTLFHRDFVFSQFFFLLLPSLAFYSQNNIRADLRQLLLSLIASTLTSIWIMFQCI